ncbi:MAG: wax ester/triacylglycerol synthase family O-acyltransferase [Gammaproteobacteria bacterium]|nr:wax ester/triacylglycerol synthase family O-acyltransferase [Gammaproteobacteria bacterium]MBK7728509.1 wax ester/triacylglycerol synthase family O-acyltransferase [Gammaproteobacteria bacterium]MBK9664439.1 wax ester/triacylglycerol synthase family O-acyltransferase [Gammaproteobacteria bacterium]MBP6052241.1 wax ester/triacylglycerol synthase family O-acyltransferase [Pseudomonadales bacterium]
MFFLSEMPASPKHVGALQIFELPPRAPKDYLKKLVARMKSQPPVPPFSYWPLFPRTGMPQWQVDENLDMDYHVRHSALPDPGDTRQLLDTVERLHGGMLDRQRPCWFCQVIEGLHGNRFAVYTKIHHACIDGMSGVRRMYAALSASPTSTVFTAPWAFEEKTAPPRAEPDIATRVAATGRTALAQARAVAELSGTLARMSLQWMKVEYSFHQVPFDAPRSLMNRPLTRDARAVGICTLPLDRVKAAGRRLGGKVNDVVLTVVDAALHEYLRHSGAPSDAALVALCPMSLREDGDHAANTQVSALHVRLGDPQADMRTRLGQVIDSSAKSKQQAREMSRDALLDFAVLMFGAYELLERTGLQERIPASYNVLVSNVPGPTGSRMYLLGSRLIASYPISTFLPGTNLNVTVLSHGNSIDFGVLADRLAMPDVARLTESIVQRFAELERAFAKPRASRARAGSNALRSKPAARR